jgi:beta-galactosidase
VRPNGIVEVAMMIDPVGKLPELPRFGVQFAVPGELEQVTWFGRGPHENYADRRASTEVSRFAARVGEFWHSYTRPQENGYRTDVRWVALTDGAGSGILVVGQPLVCVNAWPYSMRDLARAKHVNELPRRSQITVNIDAAQMGIGGDDSWGALPHPEYTLPPVHRSYSFLLMPYSKSQGDAGDVALGVR